MRPPMCLQMLKAVVIAGMNAVSIELTGVVKYIGSVSSSWQMMSNDSFRVTSKSSGYGR